MEMQNLFKQNFFMLVSSTQKIPENIGRWTAKLSDGTYLGSTPLEFGPKECGDDEIENFTEFWNKRISSVDEVEEIKKNLLCLNKDQAAIKGIAADIQK